MVMASFLIVTQPNMVYIFFKTKQKNCLISSLKPFSKVKISEVYHDLFINQHLNAMYHTALFYQIMHRQPWG